MTDAEEQAVVKEVKGIVAEAFMPFLFELADDENMGKLTKVLSEKINATGKARFISVRTYDGGKTGVTYTVNGNTHSLELFVEVG